MIRIQVSLSCPDLDFAVSNHMHALAAEIARHNRCFCFVGIDPGGMEIVATDRNDLLERNCQQIAWVGPEATA